MASKTTKNPGGCMKNIIQSKLPGWWSAGLEGAFLQIQDRCLDGEKMGHPCVDV